MRVFVSICDDSSNRGVGNNHMGLVFKVSGGFWNTAFAGHHLFRSLPIHCLVPFCTGGHRVPHIVPQEENTAICELPLSAPWKISARCILEALYHLF